MTDYYIDSTATGANTGLSWTDAWNGGGQADWTSAMSSASVAGDRIFVAHDNATTLTADFSGTVNANHTKDNPLEIIVANSATTTPVSDYGASGNGEVDAGGTYHFALVGHVYVYGLRIQNMDGVNLDSSGRSPVYERCLIGLDKTSSAETYIFNNGGEVTLIDSDISLASQAHRIYFGNDGCAFRMYGGAITSDANVTHIFNIPATKSATVELIGVDMTGINAATDIFQGGAAESFTAVLDNCNWPATIPTLYGSTISNLGDLDYIKVTGDLNEISTQTRYGQILTETTIYRDGGANDGANDYSLKVESNSTASRVCPLRHLLVIDNPGDLDTLTVKVHFAQNSGAAISDNDIWIECHTPTSTSVSSDTDRVAPSVSSTNHTDESGSVDWRNGAGALTGYNEQSCSVTVSGATTGLLYVFLCVAADFTTTNNLYVDPYPVIA